MRATQLPYLLLLAGLVSACSDSDDNDIVSWMAEQRNTIKPSVTAVAEPKKVDPAAYEGPKNGTQLFRLGGTQVGSDAERAGSGLLLPELNRRKEALEAFLGLT